MTGKTFLSRIAATLALLFLTVNSAWALKIELNLPESDVPFGIRTDCATGAAPSNEWGSYNIIPVKITRDANDGAGAITGSGGITVATSAVKFDHTGNKEYVFGVNFRHGTPDGVTFAPEDLQARWLNTTLLPANADVAYNQILVRTPYAPSTKGIIVISTESTSRETCIYGLNNNRERVLTILNDNINAPIGGTTEVRGAFLGACVTGNSVSYNVATTCTQIIGTSLTATSLTVRGEKLSTAGVLSQETTATVSVPYSAAVGATVSEPRWGCGYFMTKVTAPTAVTADGNCSRYTFTTFSGGSVKATPVNTANEGPIETLVTASYRIFAYNCSSVKTLNADGATFSHEYYAVCTEGESIKIPFILDKPFIEETQIAFRTIAGTGVFPRLVMDGTTETEAIRFQQRYGRIGTTNGIVTIDVYGEISGTIPRVYNAAEAEGYVTMKPGQTHGTLTIKTFNNGTYSQSRTLVIAPGVNGAGLSLAGSPTAQLTLIVLEAGTWPHTSIMWASAQAQVGATPVFDDNDKYYANENRIFSPRIVNHDKNLVYVWGCTDKTSETNVTFPIKTHSSYSALNGYSANMNIRISNVTPNDGGAVKIPAYNFTTQTKTFTIKSVTGTASIAASTHNELTVTVLGRPSKLDITDKITNGRIKKGQTATFEFRLSGLGKDGKVISGARSEAIVVPLKYVIPADVDTTMCARPGIDYTLPETLVIPAGAESATLRIPTHVVPGDSADSEKYLVFCVDQDRLRKLYPETDGVDYMPLELSSLATHRVALVTKDVHAKQGLWVSAPKSAAIDEIIQISAMMGSAASVTGSVRSSLNSDPAAPQVFFNVADSDNVWSTALDAITIPNSNLKPILINVRFLNGTTNAGAFNVPIEVKAGSYRKNVKVSVYDNRPETYKDYSAVTCGRGAARAKNVTIPIVMNPIPSFSQLATPAEFNEQYDPAIYDGETPYATYTNNLLNDSVTPTPTADGTGLTYTRIALNEDTSVYYGSLETFYAVKNYLGKVSADTAYITVGDEALSFAKGMGVALGSSYASLPQNAKSAFAYYRDPTSVSATDKERKIALSIKNTDSGRFAFYNGNVKLYSTKALDYKRKSGGYSSDVLQREAFMLDIGCKTAAGSKKSITQRFVVQPLITEIETWDGTNVLDPDYDVDNVLHPGSILEVSGYYFGSTPKFTVESFTNGVARPAQLSCRILATVVDKNDPAYSTIRVQMPNSFPSKWNRDEHVAHLIVNSGAGFDGLEIPLACDFNVKDYKDVPPEINPTLVAPLCEMSIKDKSIEVPILMKPITNLADTSLPQPFFMVVDANGDELTIESVRVVNHADVGQEIGGYPIETCSVHVQKDSKTKALSIICKPHNHKVGDAFAVEFTVKAKSHYAKDTTPVKGRFSVRIVE